jgi:hypothetical protein
MAVMAVMAAVFIWSLPKISIRWSIFDIKQYIERNAVKMEWGAIAPEEKEKIALLRFP